MPAYIERFGYKIQIMVRMQLKGTLFDSVNVCYMADERDEEIWSIRTTERPQHLRKIVKYRISDRQKLKFDVQEVPIDLQNSWVETGLLSNKKIQLTRSDPSSNKHYEWDVPNKAYLSQADLYLLPLILQDQPDGQWGFYAYHPNSGKISFRTERLEHKSNGNYLIYSRLAPEDIQEQVTEYDHKGKIVLRILAGGRKLIPAARRQIEARWPQFVK
ncbi:MAG: hypothetical protein JKX85_10425 [Phycisphaeraceae bacterium]|nr:hypothetical protein [Phycisphaeraceae bacterium]